MKKGILSFDLDQTLLDHFVGGIPASAMEAIEMLREDYYIVIASGRDMDLPTMLQYKEMVAPDAIVHLNGGKVSLGEVVLEEKELPSTLIEEILAEAKKEQWCLGATSENDSFFVNEEKLVEIESKWHGAEKRIFRPVEELLQHKLYSLSIREDKDVTDQMIEKFPMISVFRFGGVVGADIVRHDVSKKIGIETLLEKWGMTFEDVIAFGDSHNDIALLQAAKIGVAMGNADEEVKAAADFVTTHISDNGIWNACKALGLIK